MEAELRGLVLCSSVQAPGWYEELRRRERALDSCLESLDTLAWYRISHSTVYTRDIKRWYTQDESSGELTKCQTRSSYVSPWIVSGRLNSTSGESWGDALIWFSLFSHLPLYMKLKRYKNQVTVYKSKSVFEIPHVVLRTEVNAELRHKELSLQEVEENC